MRPLFDMRKAELNEIKDIQIKILEEVDSFCKKHNIQYFLFAGTLLGAIRHSGYIPWDDDLDICMLRNDYDLFIKSYSSNTTYLLSPYCCDKYYYPFAKVVKRNTLSCEPCKYTDKLGINIDVFPIDGIPSDRTLRQSFIRKVNRYRNLLSMLVYFSDYSIWEKIKASVHLALHGIAEKGYYVKRLDQEAASYKDIGTELCGNLVWGIGLREAVPSSVFCDSIGVIFEGKEYPAPVGFDIWLRTRYGDYMILPPEEQRKGHNREDYFLEG